MAWNGTPTWTISTTQGTPTFSVTVKTGTLSTSGSPSVRSTGQSINIRDMGIRWSGSPTWSVIK